MSTASRSSRTVRSATACSAANFVASTNGADIVTIPSTKRVARLEAAALKGAGAGARYADMSSVNR